jgi:hypothetical protein
MPVHKCKICGGNTTPLQDTHMNVGYHVCLHCTFIEKDKQYHLTYEQEKKEYLRHNNTLENIGYVNMFQKIIDDHIKPLNINQKVLDYGSGPVPVFREILLRNGYDIYDYDPFYNNDDSYLKNQYQLITSIEVVEHFYSPIKEFKHIVALLEEDGYLLIRTELREMNDDAFLSWWYRRDVSHVSFYNIAVFQYLETMLPLKLIYTNNKNIVILHKQKEKS